jgi:hypothetical protein
MLPRADEQQIPHRQTEAGFGQQVMPEAWVEKSTHANEMVKFHDVETGGYEYLWWVEYEGAHLPEASLPAMYWARGAGGITCWRFRSLIW